MRRPLLVLLAGSATCWLTGCVVYMPMQCAAPQINDRNQAEITGSSYLNGRVEVAGTYSPVRHLLVRAAYSNLGGNPKDSSYYRGRQYDVGMGTYWQVGPRWLVGGLAGYGQARSEAGFAERGFLFGSGRNERHDFDVRFNKVFGEVYAMFQPNDVFSLGAAYRVNQVNFTTFTDRGTPVDLSSMARGEPMIFVRARLGHGPANTRPVQLQLAWGGSGTFGYREGRDEPTISSVGRLKQGRGYTTFGVSVFLHCLFPAAQVPAPVPGP